MGETPVQLVVPSAERAEAYAAFVEEFRLVGEEDYLLQWQAALEDLPAHVRRLADQAAGRNLPRGHVPQSTFWLIDEAGDIVGELRIRHRLTPALRDSGGHVGYAVRPSRRGRGIGTRMLALGLRRAGDLGLKRVLLTCSPSNVASVRVIEHNGGRLVWQGRTLAGKRIRRYEIDL